MNSQRHQMHTPKGPNSPHAERRGDGWLPLFNRFPLRRLDERAEISELLDGGYHDENELRENFRDMRRVNSLLGGTEITIRAVRRLTGNLRRGDTFSILDIGTGHGDIPRAVAHWAQYQGIQLNTVGVDIDTSILASARYEPQTDDLFLVAGDGERLPLHDKSVDIAMSSMTLHHMTDEQATATLREMARVSRIGIIVNDLTRTAHGYLGAWLLAHLTTRNRLTRNDAPISVRRSRTVEEMADLARVAGLQAPVFDSKLGYRVAMTIGVRPW